MRIDDLRLSRLEIPFKVKFRHAAAERSRMASVWVEARGNGLLGVGEGCPREYVTGESLTSAEEFFRRTRDAVVGEVRSVDDLRAWQSGRASEIDANPSAWCAVELALLDLFARDERRSVESLIGAPPLSDGYRYSAVLGDGDFPTFLKTALKYRAFGLKDFKVKLSGESTSDKRKLRTLRVLGVAAARIRVDANNLWHSPDEAAEYLCALGPLAAIEEPIAAGDFEGMRRIAERTGARIILDESLLHAGQLSEIAQDPRRWVVNVRVSKMGGLLRSLDVARRARELGVGVIVGAQVGETSVLSRAALPVAQAAGEALYAQEGAFGTRLLQHDICPTPLMFGFGGLLKTHSLKFNERPGWGLEPARGDSAT